MPDGADGSVTVSTAQMRLYVVAQVAPGGGALGSSGVSLVTIPIYVEAASAQADAVRSTFQPVVAGVPISQSQMPKRDWLPLA